jgi:hypothetical protein
MRKRCEQQSSVTDDKNAFHGRERRETQKALKRIKMEDFNLQLVFRPHTDTAQASRVQIMQNQSKLLSLPK